MTLSQEGLLERLTPAERYLLDGLTQNDQLWKPHHENVPQIMGYTSEADILYFGGAAGGGKSDLLLGLALTAHTKSIIFRREFLQLRELVDRSQEILELTKARYNQTFTRWTGIPGRRTLEFGAVQHEKFREKYKGRPHDLKAFDEICDFPENVFRFLIAWNRSTNPGQRCRVVCAGNPPTHVDGEWVIRYWAPWLSENHPNPAKSGEIRWFAGIDGKDVEVKSGGAFLHKGELIKPLSRSFILAKLGDNPYLRDTNYRAVLQALPEPLRSQLLDANFHIRSPDNLQQVIPTEWVKAAQARWRERDRPPGPIDVIGVDPSRGGADTMELAPRIGGNYYLPLVSCPGEAVPDGPAAAGLVVSTLGEDDEAEIHIDIIGIGSSAFDILAADDYNVVAVNFAEGTDETDLSGKLKLRNVRAAAYWKFREALDPESGRDIALPPDDEMVADLVAPCWAMTSRGITVEPKKDIRKRLHRSPGKGDAVVMADYDAAPGVFFL